jgi:hypothetical protein
VMVIELSISNAGSRSIYTPPYPSSGPLPAPLSSRGVRSCNLPCIKPLRKSHLICTSQASSYSRSSSKPLSPAGTQIGLLSIVPNHQANATIPLAVFYMQVHGTSYGNPRLVRATSISALHIPGAMWHLASRGGPACKKTR